MEAAVAAAVLRAAGTGGDLPNVQPAPATGVIVSVRGAVVDVAFDTAALPPVSTGLVVEWDRPEPLVLEVHSHVDPATVRGIAMQATSGLARGTKVRATGTPITVPVGEAVLGRLLDVVGTLRDRGPALPAGTPPARHPQPAPGAEGRDLGDGPVPDRHQGDRPAGTPGPGRQGRDVRRRRRRQDGAGDGADPAATRPATTAPCAAAC